MAGLLDRRIDCDHPDNHTQQEVSTHSKGFRQQNALDALTGPISAFKTPHGGQPMNSLRVGECTLFSGALVSSLWPCFSTKFCSHSALSHCTPTAWSPRKGSTHQQTTQLHPQTSHMSSALRDSLQISSSIAPFARLLNTPISHPLEGELNTPKQKKSFLVGPTEPAGGGSFLWVAMALAGVGLTWPSQLDLRERSGPKHPTWIALVGWLDAGGESPTMWLSCLLTHGHYL